MFHAVTSSDNRKHERTGIFAAVLDSRKRKIRGLWQRNGRYYAQLRVDLGDGTTAPRRIALEANDLDEAKAELERKRTERRDNELPERGFRPRFDDFAREYIASPTLAQKKEGTQQNERQAIARWVKHLGGVRVDRITPKEINAFREARMRGGTSARTVNLDTVALKNVLKLATDRGLISAPPVVKQLKQRPSPKKPLFPDEQFVKLLKAVTPEVTKNASLLRLYLQFLAFTGAREKESLAVRWTDVDFKRETVTIGADGVSKNHKARAVNFSGELSTLLEEMRALRPPDCSWLFPSPQRGNKDKPARSLRSSLNLVRDAAGLPEVGFHDLRHAFASRCVMSGIDFMTIAGWLGHSDGGILVAKVYGHLSDTHKKSAALKLRKIAGGAALA